ncbi:MAG: hypothetical protein Q7U33_10070 [Methylotenera sp.]|uniref:hypothetical protein n=1 Tax=Methylotenera sp. TaxID=2051956 RepID=UPI002717DF6D|nr:hypothetical protein [Methylotenera sp.]MDO9151711.1 hypothetical protein [Methylotenera sp.]
MNLSIIENEILDLLLDDYEAPETIAQNISIKITKKEILSVLDSLTTSGLVQPFIYDTASQQYKKIEPASTNPNQEVWFLATSVGRNWAANNG